MKKNLVTLLLFACHFITTQALERAIINKLVDPKNETVTAHLHYYQNAVFYDCFMTRNLKTGEITPKLYKSSIKAGAFLAELTPEQLEQINILLRNALAKVA